MQVIVSDLMKAEKGTLVRFTCDVGDGVGLWVGAPPEANRSYVVEFEIVDRLTIGENVETSTNSGDRSESHGTAMVFVGTLEARDVDGTTTLRIGESILLLDVPGTLAIGSRVAVGPVSVRLYDSNV